MINWLGICTNNLVSENIVSTIFLCEAEKFISLARLLDEEDREDKETQRGPTPWADTDSQSYPMLAKGWVDALDQAKDAGETWRKLAALPPQFIPYMSFMYFLPGSGVTSELLIVPLDDRRWKRCPSFSCLVACPTSSPCYFAAGARLSLATRKTST